MAAISTGATMSAQFNVRMDRRLKEAGDRALACASISPSHAVRALWGRLANHPNDPEAVRQIVEPAPASLGGTDDIDDARERDGHALAVKGASLFASTLDGMGISPSDLPISLDSAQDDRELLESELLDSLVRRGMGS